jgi:hypothetical protein
MLVYLYENVLLLNYAYNLNNYVMYYIRSMYKLSMYNQLSIYLPVRDWWRPREALYLFPSKKYVVPLSPAKKQNPR